MSTLLWIGGGKNTCMLCMAEVSALAGNDTIYKNVGAVDVLYDTMIFYICVIAYSKLI